MTAPEIFDRTARRLHRDRAAGQFASADFLHRFMMEGLTERLAGVKRTFRDMLDLGCWDAGFPPPSSATVVRADPGRSFAKVAGGVQCDEDRLPFADEAFDLVVSVGVLDQINDLPGALRLIRRVLRPDGLFLGAFLGAGTLPALRAALRAAQRDQPVARMHPQIDVRSAGDLLARAGFALPVADTESLSVRYGSLFDLLRDLRGMAATNSLRERHLLRRSELAAAAQAFAAQTDESGRTAERFEIVYCTGWAPDASQPQPARRGSATASLADALKPPSGESPG
ncbi:class I SAM-dependent methyltransferase [Stakelama saccharophila]|uniref:Methyltransferase domain-containing protein n=1 Tax=Stakelama saccharophila TaxID=3075605 RepID=A0ABZ0B5U4_9SPHN|nr:methyltransferase domain-containing protein [Stakelama sp. W311]WNO52665.1 methyltransferase domain-containing protein [Stakelama sp. W311]